MKMKIKKQEENSSNCNSNDIQKICKLSKLFKNFTGYDVENFSNFNNFLKWLLRPTDAAALGIFRILFGLAMLIDIPEEREGSHIDVKFGDPKNCHFPLIDTIQPLKVQYMAIVYLIMWLGAMGIILGFKFKFSCLLFNIPYWYIFLLDKPAWNNHSYLYGLCGFLLFWTDAHKFYSIDYWQLKQNEQKIPYWNYFLIKFQFFILYFYAGLKKLSIEWLSGYSMTNLGYHWLFIPLRYFISVELIELIIIHWTTAIFDVSIAFWMTWNKSRKWATPFMLVFHIMNSRLFSIGMFPWVCLAELHLFFEPNWPRNIKSKLKILFYGCSNEIKKENCTNCSVSCTNGKNQKLLTSIGKENVNGNLCSPINSKESNKYNKEMHINDLKHASFKEHLKVFFICLYCSVQLFLPYSHFITKGYNNWTNGLYGYSWDMMVHSYDTISVSVRIVDNKYNVSHFLNPYAFSQYDRWTKHSDMAYQYAKCIQRNLLNDFKVNPNPVLKSRNFSIYFDIWCSMNGRFQQRVYDPKQDLMEAKWNPFKKTSWVLPLLHELNYMRPKLNEITKNVLNWSNYSDVLFIADFPGLTLENYIAPELFNVTLSVIEGNVEFMDRNSSQILSSGENYQIRSGHHQIVTRGYKPSCYMYTFVNKTMLEMKEDVKHPINQEKWLPIVEELSVRLENYKDFFYHVGNSLLFLIYGVPMPIRVREDI